MKYQYGYTAKLARQAGITRAYLSLIFQGKRRPGYQVAKRLSELTETSPVTWMENDPDALFAAIDRAGERARQKMIEDEDRRLSESPF